MLRSIEDFSGYAIEASDGPIGHVRDFHFDDAAWVLRYFVVETGAWLARRKVLISPIGMGLPDDAKKGLPVSLTRAQVRESPDLDTDRPVSHEDEQRFMAFNGYPDYCGGTGLWGDGATPNLTMPGIDPVTIGRLARSARSQPSPVDSGRAAGDRHLRSFATIVTYRLHASDGEIGHVRGLLVDDASWAIRYLIVDTADWWLGQRVLIAPARAEGIDWLEGTISVAMTRRQVKDAPLYDPDQPIGRDRECALLRSDVQSDDRPDDPDFESAASPHP